MGYWIAAFLITAFFSGIFKLIKGTTKAVSNAWNTTLEREQTRRIELERNLSLKEMAEIIAALEFGDFIVIPETPDAVEWMKVGREHPDPGLGSITMEEARNRIGESPEFYANMLRLFEIAKKEMSITIKPTPQKLLEEYHKLKKEGKIRPSEEIVEEKAGRYAAMLEIIGFTVKAKTPEAERLLEAGRLDTDDPDMTMDEAKEEIRNDPETYHAFLTNFKLCRELGLEISPAMDEILKEGRSNNQE